MLFSSTCITCCSFPTHDSCLIEIWWKKSFCSMYRHNLQLLFGLYLHYELWSSSATTLPHWQTAFSSYKKTTEEIKLTSFSGWLFIFLDKHICWGATLLRVFFEGLDWGLDIQYIPNYSITISAFFNSFKLFSNVCLFNVMIFSCILSGVVVLRNFLYSSAFSFVLHEV